MALIRGLGCLCPCPKCYVPWDVLSNLSEVYDSCTAEKTASVLEEASTLPADEKEDLLKEHGLHDAQASWFITPKVILNELMITT